MGTNPISFKKIGDWFMADAICESGYTYAFIFRNSKVPPIIHYLYTTSKRVLYLMKTVPNDWVLMYMDNSFKNVKLCWAAFIEKCLVHGVTRKAGRGIPDTVRQIEVKSNAN